MRHEVRNIPAAPRRVRSGPILAHRWPMAALGLFLVVFGGLFSWMLFLASGAKPSEEARLNRGPNDLAVGIITEVEPIVFNGPGGSRWHRVRYAFEYGGNDLTGFSLVQEGSVALGQNVDLEVVPHPPNANRVAGGTLHFDFVLLRPQFWFGMTVVPGLFMLCGWVVGTFQLRRVLVHGDVSTGTISSVEPIRWMLPESLRITYEFRDHRAVMRRGRHWIRARSTIGMQAQHQMSTGWFEPLPVLHDRQLPQWNRMVLARDFLPRPTTTEGLEQIG